MFTFSANLAYLPSSVTKSAEHFFKCARRYFRTNLSTGRITEHAKARRLQCLKLTLEFGSGWSVVCLINCKNSSLTKQSFFMALSNTFWIRKTWSSSSWFLGFVSVAFSWNLINEIHVNLKKKHISVKNTKIVLPNSLPKLSTLKRLIFLFIIYLFILSEQN